MHTVMSLIDLIHPLHMLVRVLTDYRQLARIVDSVRLCNFHCYISNILSYSLILIR